MMFSIENVFLTNCVEFTPIKKPEICKVSGFEKNIFPT